MHSMNERSWRKKRDTERDLIKLCRPNTNPEKNVCSFVWILKCDKDNNVGRIWMLASLCHGTDICNNLPISYCILEIIRTSDTWTHLWLLCTDIVVHVEETANFSFFVHWNWMARRQTHKVYARFFGLNPWNTGMKVICWDASLYLLILFLTSFVHRMDFLIPKGRIRIITMINNTSVSWYFAAI